MAVKGTPSSTFTRITFSATSCPLILRQKHTDGFSELPAQNISSSTWAELLPQQSAQAPPPLWRTSPVSSRVVKSVLEGSRDLAAAFWINWRF